MADHDLKTQLAAEIARIKSGIDAQKLLIKKNLGKQLIIETAEAEMRALRARLAVLEANMAQYPDSSRARAANEEPSMGSPGTYGRQGR